MSQVRSEIYETYADKIPGVDKLTIRKLENSGIETLQQLQDMGWQKVMEISHIGPKKIIPLFDKVGVSISEDEAVAYNEEIKKHKISTESSIATTETTITAPQKITKEDMEAITEQVKPDVTAITREAISRGATEITLVSGEKIILTPEEQKFKKIVLTTDMENFIIKLLDEKDFKKYTETIRETVLNSTDKLVPTGARAHVKQWINLLEKKVEGRKLSYSLQTMNDPSQYKKVLEPLIDDVIKGVTGELANGSLFKALDEIEKSRKSKDRPRISTDSIMHTIILYKIFIDAKGSAWDLNPTTGQLGVTFSDGEEFIRRMRKALGVPESEPEDSPTNIAIKRTWSAYQSGLAVLLAGMPGSGKTFFSKATGEQLTDNVWGTLPFTRVNITGGLEPSDLLGEWDYQAQILALEASRIRVGNVTSLTGEEINKLRENIYTIDYFRFGPVALSMIQGVPILIDEVNRGSPDIQNVLLQAIDENEVVIPGIGRIKATPGFFVISTINEQDVGTTELGGAFLRRVIYIYFDEPSDYTKWVKSEFPTINDKLLRDMEKVRKAIKEKTTISGEIPPSSMLAWSKELVNIWGPSIVLDKNKIILTLGTLLKTKSDIDEVKTRIDEIIREAGILS